MEAESASFASLQQLKREAAEARSAQADALLKEQQLIAEQARTKVYAQLYNLFFCDQLEGVWLEEKYAERKFTPFLGGLMLQSQL